MAHTLFIIRHGNTFGPGEIVRRVGGRTDLPLVTSGIEQAGALGEYFREAGIEPAKIFTGPLKRTVQTAEIIASAQPNPVGIEELTDLREIDYGLDENKPEKTVIDRIGEAALADWEKDSIPPEGWIVDPGALIKAWQKLFTKISKELPPTASVFAVTSNGVARFSLEAARQTTEEFPKKLRTGAFGKITIDTNGQGIAEQWDIRP